MAKKTIAPVVATPEPQEVALVLAEHKIILPWVKNLAAWWTVAKRMTAEAITLRAQTLQLTAPKTEAEDLEIQERILDARNRGKQAEDHYEPVTGVLFKMHRRLTSSRAGATKPLEEADAHLQNLHNTYVREQQRIAQEADRKAREEAERQAEEQRQRELEEMEARAVAAEESSAELSERERSFVKIVAGGLGAQQAAKMAGYLDALKSAARLMTLPKIKTAINDLKDAAAIRRQAEAVKELPIVPQQPTMPVRTAVSKVAGIRSKSTWGVKFKDKAALHEAALRGEVPPDVLMIDEARVRKYAEDMHELIDAWPGVEHTETTTTY